MERLHSALSTVSPSDCAVAITIPLTREQFLDDLSRPFEKDLVHHFRSGKGLKNADPEYCWEIYASEEAAFAEAILSEVERQGVTVVRGARLADLSALLSNFRVVTLVAHQRSVPIEMNDVLDARRLLQLIRSPQNALQRSLTEKLAALGSPLLKAEPVNQLGGVEIQRLVADEIHSITDIAEHHAAGEVSDWDFGTQRPFRRVLIRLEFELAYPEYIVPGRVVEFGDRLRSVREVVESIPDAFSGLIDLTLCRSVIPAASIRASRPNCLVVASRKPKELRSALYLYGLQIKLLAENPAPFIEVIKQVHIGQQAYKRKGGRLWALLGRFFKNTQGR